MRPWPQNIVNNIKSFENGKNMCSLTQFTKKNSIRNDICSNHFLREIKTLNEYMVYKNKHVVR